MIPHILPLSLAVLIALSVIGIGSFYIAAPQRVLGSFGLKPSATDADTLAWLHLKGIRDVGAGIAVLTVILTTDDRTVGILLLALAIIPLGDMWNVLASGGSKTAAYSIHGVTCLVMLLAGLLLIHAI